MTGDERSREEPTNSVAPPAFLPPAAFANSGPFGWAFCKLAARRQRIAKVNLFTTLVMHRSLLLAWLPYSGYLLFAGKLSRARMPNS